MLYVFNRKFCVMNSFIFKETLSVPSRSKACMCFNLDLHELLHLNISALCLECICAYHILDNAQPSYLSNDCQPALQLTHQLPSWPGEHPNISGPPIHCKQRAEPGNAEPSICEKSCSALFSLLRLGVMLANQMASFYFFSRANGTNERSSGTNLHARQYTQNLSQVRIWLHIITIYKKIRLFLKQ